MNPVVLTFREIFHRWKSSLLVALIVASITGTLTYFSVNNSGFQKEITRNARDIGSNVVILPADVDQFQYHAEGGYSEKTMSFDLVQQLIEYRASLNHLIPMLERKADCVFGDLHANARIVGVSASVPMPGRPKAPMQKSVNEGEVQLGGRLAEQLGVGRDDSPDIQIDGKTFKVSRVNRVSGTWQDAAAFLDLKAAQTLFGLENQISRVEAIECTSEQCELTGLKSDVVLANELARITDQASLLRREKMAEARSNIRVVSRENLGLLQNVLWVLLALAIMALSSLNSYQRKSEVGVLQALGYGQWRVVTMFVLRAVLLTMLGAAIGVALGAFAALVQSQPLFVATGKKFAIDWQAVVVVGAVATVLAALASSLPALLAAARHPAELIGRDN